MSKKKVYAALEIADKEIRLLVFENNDGRQNVLRVERIPHHAVSAQRITDEAAIVKAIQSAVANAQQALGYRIERVLLAVPSINAKLGKKTVHVQIENGAKNIRLFHIQQGYKSAVRKKASDDTEFANVTSIAYMVNGLPTMKMPIGEETDDFYMEVRMAYADRDILYTYTKAVEQSNLEVMGLALDVYASALETAAFGQSSDFPVIQINLEPEHTALSYFDKQKMINTVSIPEGYSSFIEEIRDKYSLDDEQAFRLLENVFSADVDNMEDMVVYIEEDENGRVEITSRELANSVVPKIREWIKDVDEGCRPLIESSKKARYLLTGQGAGLPVFADLLPEFSAEAMVYQPTAIGARDDALSDVLGLGHVINITSQIEKNDKISVNNNELESSLDSIKSHSSKEEDGSFTKKIKNVILQSE